METGILPETKLKGKTRQRIVKAWVYATSNNVEKISTLSDEDSWKSHETLIVERTGPSGYD
jgi:hypothetical protein